MGPGFRARDTAVTVVVPQGHSVHFGVSGSPEQPELVWQLTEQPELVQAG